MQVPNHQCLPENTILLAWEYKPESNQLLISLFVFLILHILLTLEGARSQLHQSEEEAATLTPIGRTFQALTERLVECCLTFDEIEM